MRRQALRYNINLIRDIRIPKKVRFLAYRFAAVYLLIGIAVICFLAGSYINGAHLIKKLSADTKDRASSTGIADYKDEIRGDALVYKNLLAQNLKELSRINSFLSKQVNISPKLERLGYYLPPNTWIDRIDFMKKDSRLAFTGVTVIDKRFEATTLTGEFIKNLKNDPAFMMGISDVRLVSTERRVMNGVDTLIFHISSVLSDNSKGAGGAGL